MAPDVMTKAKAALNARLANHASADEAGPAEGVSAGGSAGQGVSAGGGSAQGALPASSHAKPVVQKKAGPTKAPLDVLRERWSQWWPVASVVLAVVLWWPAGFLGRSDWMTMPLEAASGDAVLLGTWVAAGVVGALVHTPWPKFGLVLGLTTVAWLLSPVAAGAVAGERTALAALAAIGSLLGVWLGSKAAAGPIQVAVMLAWVSGLSPATWSRSVLLAIAVALPFMVASADRVGPTMWAIFRVVLTWLVAVVASLALRAAWVAIPAGGLATPVDTTRGVLERFVDHVRANGLDIGRAALENSTEWLPMSFLIAVAIVGVRFILTHRPAR